MGRGLALLFLVVLLLGGLTVAGYAGNDDACLACHSNLALKTANGGEASLFVDEERFSSSVHGALGCTVCHTEIKGVPHKDPVYGQKLKDSVNESCGNCHPGAKGEYAASIHATEAAGARCSDCHGSHEVRRVGDPASLVSRANVETTCGACHSGEVLDSYRESFHGTAVRLGSTRSATCVSCHGSHGILPPEDPASSVSKANVPETCAQCHRSAEKNFAVGANHFLKKPGGPGAPIYFTEKFFVWLTILTMLALVIHIEIELIGEWRRKSKKPALSGSDDNWSGR